MVGTVLATLGKWTNLPMRVTFSVNLLGFDQLMLPHSEVSSLRALLVVMKLGISNSRSDLKVKQTEKLLMSSIDGVATIML